MRPVEPSDVSPADADSLRVSLREATDVVDPSWPDFEDLRRSAVRRRHRRSSLATAASVLAVTAAGATLAVTLHQETSPGAGRPLDFTVPMSPSESPSASPTAAEPSAISAYRSATAAETAAQHAAYMRGLQTLQDYLDSWASDGYRAACDSYLPPENQLPPGEPGIVLLSGKVLGYHPASWTSPGEFTLAVDFNLRFPGNPVAVASWGEGRNSRFVTFERVPGPVPFQMSFATGP